MQHFTFGAWARALVLALIGGAILSLGTPSQAQAPSNLSGQQLALNRAGEALERVVTSAKKVNGKLGYGFYESGCVFGVMLRPGASTSETFGLNAGQSYVFIGGGDKSARNVDVILSDSSGKVVKKDTEQDAAPFVLFKPTRTGRYKMSLRLSSARSGTAFCAVTVLRKGGYDVPLDRLVQAVTKAAVAAGLIFRGVNGGRFNQDSDTWALYGAVLKPKQSISSDPKHYRTANRGFVGVGDDRVKDLDLLLLNSKRQLVAADTKNGAGAALAYKTIQGNYSVGLVNNSSTGPALVMAILMELPAGVNMSPDNQAPPRTGGGVSRPVPGRASPFLGHWSGDWFDEPNNQEGDFEMTVRADGNLTGKVTNTTANVSSPVRGYIRPDGAFVFTYSYQGQNYVAQGTMRFLHDMYGGIGGTVTFSSNGTVIGKGDFDLDKDDDGDQ
ncbi:hypothetical protein IAD21_04803 [Abditibacteriota bacterium]|nr:hypothetical protein IAD21_04803 [Abditibacteriota bacterium]